MGWTFELMTVFNPSSRYQAFLLRCWEERCRQSSTWRFSLEDPHTGEQRGFASLHDLFTFLQAMTTSEDEPPESQSEK